MHHLKYDFRGLTKSHIYFVCIKDQKCTSGKWILQSLLNQNMTKELLDSEFPVGTKIWNAMGQEKKLTLTQCFQDKFTCDSGHCISLTDKCNVGYQCKDHTDEHYCNSLHVGNDYLKEILPISETVNTCIIFINISVLAFPLISTKDVKFTADFNLNLRWHDLRITLSDLDQDYNLNTLSTKEIETIWMPKVSFTNSLGPLNPVDSLIGLFIQENAPLKDDISQATEGNFCPSPPLGCFTAKGIN